MHNAQLRDFCKEVPFLVHKKSLIIKYLHLNSCKFSKNTCILYLN